jgi:hypothetical protein
VSLCELFGIEFCALFGITRPAKFGDDLRQHQRYAEYLTAAEDMLTQTDADYAPLRRSTRTSLSVTSPKRSTC